MVGQHLFPDVVLLPRSGQPRVRSSALAVWVKDGERWLLLALQPAKYPG